MRPETASCLADARLACERIVEITSSLSSTDYAEDWRTQLAVERLFTIVGEAVVRVRDLEQAIYLRLPLVSRIIGFRNLLVHAYDAIAPTRVYDIAIVDVPNFLVVLNQLLLEADAQGL